MTSQPVASTAALSSDPASRYPAVKPVMAAMLPHTSASPKRSRHARHARHTGVAPRLAATRMAMPLSPRRYCQPLVRPAGPHQPGARLFRRYRGPQPPAPPLGAALVALPAAGHGSADAPPGGPAAAGPGGRAVIISGRGTRPRPRRRFTVGGSTGQDLCRVVDGRRRHGVTPRRQAWPRSPPQPRRVVPGRAAVPSADLSGGPGRTVLPGVIGVTTADPDTSASARGCPVRGGACAGCACAGWRPMRGPGAHG